MFDLTSVLYFPESYQISTLVQREITLLPKKKMKIPIEYILFLSDYSESRERIWLISGKLNSIELYFFLEMERKVIVRFLFKKKGNHKEQKLNFGLDGLSSEKERNEDNLSSWSHFIGNGFLKMLPLTKRILTNLSPFLSGHEKKWWKLA